jgi:hypothetical protein
MLPAETKTSTTMTIDQLKAVLQASPFRPFRIRTADGKSIPVLHQEVVFLIPNDQTVIATKERGGFYIIGANSITHLETVSDPAGLEELIKESRG